MEDQSKECVNGTAVSLIVLSFAIWNLCCIKVDQTGKACLEHASGLMSLSFSQLLM